LPDYVDTIRYLSSRRWGQRVRDVSALGCLGKALTRTRSPHARRDAQRSDGLIGRNPPFTANETSGPRTLQALGDRVGPAGYVELYLTPAVS
jgi:hypothetical protein